MTALDRLRPPPTLDLRAPAYKDWLHVNVFDHAAGMVTLFNASLHGDPEEPRSLAVGTVVVADLDGDLAAEVMVTDLADADVSPTSIGVGDLIALALDGDRVEVAARLPVGRGEVAVEMVPTIPPIVAEAPVRFGSGWISWRASPRGIVEGSWVDGGRGGPVDRLAAYHDHNWGRWHWGDDAGWEWAALLAEDGVTVVLTHTTDREHRAGSPVVVAVVDGVVRRFPAGTVSVGHHGRFTGDLVRLPGAMAALHGGRLRPRLPELVGVVADDGVDRIEVELTPVHGCQLITADPVVPGYGFIHELMGRFTYRGRIGGAAVSGSGLGVFEHVD